ncbi:GTP-binding protein [Flavobacteriaceae bacterium R38]|nr:GTP-binding protein [Flavobacteriaceae bacterium R38]
MKTLPNDIVLRPRFQLEIHYPKEHLLSLFEETERIPFILKRIDDHVFIKFNQEQVHFWSPQLHLEINEKDDSNSKLYGLFGPSPSLWTFFMFLHFGLATLFVAFGIWAYSNWSLKEDFVLQVAAMLFLIIIWFTLYFLGRIGKQKGKPQMHQLYQLMKDVLEKAGENKRG